MTRPTSAKYRHAILSAFGLAFAIVVDWGTSSDLDFNVIYLLPAIYAAWVGGKRLGYTIAAVSMLSIASYNIVRRHESPESGVFLTSVLSRVVIISIVVYLTAYSAKLQLETMDRTRRDPLTGLSNRIVLMERLALECDRRRRSENSFVFAYMDLDGFKAVNDTLGHDEGDQVLITVAETLRANIRPSDVVARLGGDEFCLLLSDTDHAAGLVSLERMQASVCQAMEAHGWAVTMSIGMVEAGTTGAIIPKEIIARADALMLDAKQAGKNRVVSVISRVTS